MKVDIDGRIKNLRLPDGKTALLFSIYEAVSNAVHAVEERFGKDKAPTMGKITIELSLSEDKNILAIVVKDNGIGLSPAHRTSFDTCDTQAKSAIGGRGVGRLVWFKLFRTVQVSSVCESDGHYDQIGFRFDPTKDSSLTGLTIKNVRHGELGTSIALEDIQESLSLSIAVIARNLCHHFFPYFIAGSMPLLLVRMGRREINIGQFLQTRMEVKHTEEVALPLAIGKLSFTHVYIDRKIARGLSNSILLTAQGRVVESIEVEKKFALKGLPNKQAYTCVVQGKFLDDVADQDRTSFKAAQVSLDAIKDAALIAAEQFLHEHVAAIRKAQKRIVVELLEEHPQLSLSVPAVEDYVKNLSPSMSDEDIGKTLFTLLYRHEKRIRSEIKNLSSVEAKTDAEQIESVKRLVQKVTDDSKLRLAEYTIKRHQIIQIARSMLRYTNKEDQAYEWEKALHELICPMGRMLSAHNYTDHNLWIIDDLLSYYQLFASDKPLSSLGIDGEKAEPDLIFFNPFGFRREGTNDPVVIIEFKRPGDENLSSDPIDQVLGYIEKLQNKTVRQLDGEVISDIGETTPFECIILCDLTTGARKKFERGVAQNPTPDGLGYYGFSPRHRASIRVISYKKLFRDAELRNSSFFSHLGLLPEEVNSAIADTLNRERPATEEKIVAAAL